MSHRFKGHFRASSRPQVASKITIRQRAGEDDREIVAYTRDIGMGGVFVETSSTFEMNESIDVELAAPSTWEPLVLKASVCRVETTRDGEPGGVGLRFVELTDAQNVALDDFTASLEFEE